MYLLKLRIFFFSVNIWTQCILLTAVYLITEQYLWQLYYYIFIEYTLLIILVYKCQNMAAYGRLYMSWHFAGNVTMSLCVASRCVGIVSCRVASNQTKIHIVLKAIQHSLRSFVCMARSRIIACIYQGAHVPCNRFIRPRLRKGMQTLT